MPVRVLTHPATGQTFCLGRKAPPIIHPHLRLRNYFKAGMPEPPATLDETVAALPSLSRIMLNDQLGCHSADTEVLTDRGWCKWPDYDGRSLLGTINQVTRRLKFQEPIDVQRKNYAGPMYFSDHKSVDFALTPGHRMFFQPFHIPYPYIPNGAGYGPTQFATIGELAKTSLGSRFVIPHAPSGYDGIDLKRIVIGNREWDGDDFIALLSIVISDGYVSHGETNRGRIGFYAFRDDFQPKIRALAQRLGINETPGRPGSWVFRDDALAEWMRSNGVGKSEYKRIPSLLREVSERQIKIFMEYYGDQHFHERGHSAFFSSSPGLIDDLQELLLRVGHRSSIYSRDRSSQETRFIRDDGEVVTIRRNTPELTLTEWGTKTQIGFQRLSKHPQIIDDWYDGEVFCATVPNSTLVTRRNGSVLISGNCCVITWLFGHQRGVWTGANGRCIVTSDYWIKKLYEVIAGYRDGDSSTDNGTDLQTAIHYGIGIGSFPGYVAVNAADATELRLATWLFGGLTFGMGLPAQWVADMRDLNWGVAGDAVPENGHCFGTPAKYDGSSLGTSTWGQIGSLSDAAAAKYGSHSVGGECYAILGHDWISRVSKLSPSGFDIAKLQANLQALS